MHCDTYENQALIACCTGNLTQGAMNAMLQDSYTILTICLSITQWN